MKKELVNLSNNYIANIGVSYIKLHNLHWNVVGHQFKAVHEYLESLYDALADVLDEVAEILKMDGEMPLGSLKKYLEFASVDLIFSMYCNFVGVGTILGVCFHLGCTRIV